MAWGVRAEMEGMNTNANAERTEGLRPPSSYLKPENLYMGDNGRLMCASITCAGSSAHATGRDRSGQKVQRCTSEDTAEWIHIAPDLPMRCTCGAVTLYTPEVSLG